MLFRSLLPANLAEAMGFSEEDMQAEEPEEEEEKPEEPKPDVPELPEVKKLYDDE